MFQGRPKPDTAVSHEINGETMSDTVRSGAALSRAKTTFSTIHPHTETNPMKLDWEIRPVLLLQVDDDPATRSSNPFESRPRGDLRACAEMLGIRGSDINRIDVGRYPGHFHFPRNQHWKELPTLSAPRHRFNFTHVMPMTDEFALGGGDKASSIDYREYLREGSSEVQERIFLGVETMIISTPVLDDEAIRLGTAVLDFLPEQEWPRVIGLSAAGHDVIAPDEIRRVRERFVAQERFTYNHACNMAVMAGRALFKMAHEDGYSRRLAQSTVPNLDVISWRWAHPVTLQLLHALRHEGPAAPDNTARALSQVEFEARPWTFANGLSFFKRKGSGFEFEWKGSGKYPAWTVDVGTVHNPAFPIKQMVMPHAHALFDLPAQLVRSQLIGLAEDRIAITQRGIRFLEMIGPESDDPDALLRWRTSSGEIGGIENVQAMDRWLNNAFRNMKRKVAPLPASPFTEKTDEPWKEALVDRLVVRGVVIPIEDDDLKSPAFVGALRDLEIAGRDLPQRERRMGILRDEERLGRERRANSLWIGIPLGVFDTADVIQERTHLFRDLTALDEDVKALVAAAPAILRKEPFVSRIRTALGDLVDLPCERFVELPPQLEVNHGDVVTDVIEGQVLRIADVKKEGFDLRSLVLSHIAYREMPGHGQTVDGIRVYGDGNPSATLSFGVLSMMTNKTTGATTPTRLLSADRQRELARNHRRMLTTMSAFFDHPSLSEAGLWEIQSDGKVSRARTTPLQSAMAGSSPEVATVTPEAKDTSVQDTASDAQDAKASETQVSVSEDAEDRTTGAPADGAASMTRTRQSATDGAKLDQRTEEQKERDSKSARRSGILDRIYKEEWLKAIDPEGVIDVVKQNPMSILSVVGVPTSHHKHIGAQQPDAVAADIACGFVSMSPSSTRTKSKTENEYAQQLRKYIGNGNSVVYLAGDNGYIPAVFEANGTVLRTQYNVFGLMARVMLRCEKAFADEGLDPITMMGGDDIGAVAEVLRKDGSLFYNGCWTNVHISPRLLGAVSFKIMADIRGKRPIDVGTLAAMGLWESRTKLSGAPQGDGPATLADIPGIGRVRHRLESLHRKMEAGNGGKVGIIFHGKPGTGKTMIARTLARDTGRHFVLGSFAEWQSAGEGHLGSTLAAMKAAFDEAKTNQPALLFLDEMDSLGTRSGSEGKNSEYFKVVINAFLEHCSGFHGRGDVVLVGATNDIKALDPAITRHGRLGCHVLIDLPNRDETREIVDWLIRKRDAVSRVEDGIDTGRYADLLEGCSPADITAVFDEAVAAADDDKSPLSGRHIDSAIAIAGGSKALGKDVSGFFVLHEAARLVAMHLLGDLEGVACARSHPGISSQTGIVLSSAGEGGSMTSQLVTRLKTSLAGMAGAAVTSTNDTDIGSTAKACIDYARRLARDLVGLAMAPGNRVSFTPMTNDHAVDDAITAWLTWAYSEATSLLAGHAGTIMSLADELSRRQHMSGTDVASFLVTRHATDGAKEASPIAA
jgi:DNA polymerase III delta prime subunit